MRRHRPLRLAVGLTTLALASALLAAPASAGTTSERLSVIDLGGAETVAFDAATKRAFVSNADEVAVGVVDLTDPSAPALVTKIDMTPYGGGVTSVAASNGLVAVAVSGATVQDPGSVVFFRAVDLSVAGVAATGALPDAVTFTPDGTKAVTANEGEPNADYSVDPDGGVTVIPISGGVPGAPTTVGFDAFAAQQAALVAGGLRVFGPGADLSADLEPEYVAVSADSRTAYVTLQENNGIAVVDLTVPAVTAVVPLGTKDYGASGNMIDASDRDGIDGNLANWPVRGMYLPDQIAIVGGYVISANEGDAREYDTFAEEARVKDLTLDPTAFPNAAELQADAAIGRLTVSAIDGDTDGDGDIDVIHAYGGRSISVWSPAGELVWDSGDTLERQVLALTPGAWDDGRSDNKGPEPEGLTTGTVAGRTYVYVALERTSGIAVFDVTTPTAPVFVTIMQPPADTDVSPEGLTFVPADQSPNRRPLVLAAYEVSGTFAVWGVGAELAGGVLPATGDDSVLMLLLAGGLVAAGAAGIRVGGRRLAR